MKRNNQFSTTRGDFSGVEDKPNDGRNRPLNSWKKSTLSNGRNKTFVRFLASIVVVISVCLLLSSPEENYLFHRKLSTLNRRNKAFLPQLEYTNSGVFPNSEGTKVSFHFPSDDKNTKDDTPQIQSGQEFSFTISDLAEHANGKVNTLCPLGLLVWIESIDTKAVFAVPAFSKNEDDENNNDLIVRTAIEDPGRYRIHVVPYHMKTLEAGAHGTVGDIRPLPESPWLIDVLPNEQQDAADQDTVDKTSIQLPTRICDSSDLEYSGKGRWVECATANIPEEQCLYDGWVYLPNNCQWDLLPHIDALNLSKEIADNRDGKPVWIVVTGSSIERGTLHALVDMLGGIGRYDPDPSVNGVRESIADSLFKGVENIRGAGSTVKCWGWYDVQIGNIRLSYLDWRMTYNKDDTFRETSLNTWKEILEQGPDTVVVGELNDMSYLITPFTEMIEIAADIPTFKGNIVYSPQKPRFFSGGIGNSFVCRKDLPEVNQLFADRDTSSDSNPPTMVDFARESVNKVLKQCGDRCSDIEKRIIVSEETTMAWSFIMDTEHPMSSTTFSQHYHVYTESAFPRRACGSSYSNRRYVVGSVTEMSAAMHLSTTLDRLYNEMGKKLSDRQHRSKCDLFESEEQEVELASTHKFKACFSCPKKACCDFPNTRWLPAMIPGQSLSDPILKNTVPYFHHGDMEFCYDGSQ